MKSGFCSQYKKRNKNKHTKFQKSLLAKSVFTVITKKIKVNQPYKIRRNILQISVYRYQFKHRFHQILQTLIQNWIQTKSHQLLLVIRLRLMQENDQKCDQNVTLKKKKMGWALARTWVLSWSTTVSPISIGFLPARNDLTPKYKS